MKLLVTNPIVRYHDSPRHVPLGILQLLAILERDQPSIKFQLYDANAYRVDDFWHGKMTGLDQVLASDDFDIIATGGLITGYNYMKAAIKRSRELQPDAKIVAGGGFLTALPTDIMGFIPEIDYGVIGEAYETFPKLAKALADGDATADGIPGLVYRNHGELLFSEPRTLIPDLDWLPYPAYKYAPLEVYFANSGILMSEEAMKAKKRLDYNFSLSCPFVCKFCWDLGITSNLKYTTRDGRVEPLNGRPTKDSVVRQHSPVYIGRFIEWIRKSFLDIPYDQEGNGVGYPVDFIAWFDENIVAHNAQTGFTWLKEIEEELWKRNLIAECLRKGVRHNPDDCSGIHMGGTSHAGLATKEVLETMHRIGFTYCDYGLESWDREILRDLGKGSSPERNANAIKLTLQAGMAPIPNQIIGFPLETWQTINEMLDAWERTGIATVPFLMTPYPGSEWFTEYRDQIIAQYGGSLEGFISDLEDATKVTAVINKNFSPAELVGIQGILGAAAKSQDFGNARRLLSISEGQWINRREAIIEQSWQGSEHIPP